MTQEKKLKSGQIFFHNIGVKCYIYILQFHNTFFLTNKVQISKQVHISSNEMTLQISPKLCEKLAINFYIWFRCLPGCSGEDVS